MISAATILDRVVKAVCPIHGVSVGRVADKATWRIDFADEATPDQRSAAAKVIDVIGADDLKQQVALHAAVEAVESACGMSRKERDLAALLPEGAYLKTKAADAEAAIQALGIRA